MSLDHLTVLLDLSAAFDTIDHDVLRLHRLSDRFGFSNKVLEWFSSYLQNRSQCVIIKDCFSKPRKLKYGVLRGSILGPL